MKKSRFTESQIVSILTTYEKGQKVSDLCREHGIRQATFFINGSVSMVALRSMS